MFIIFPSPLLQSITQINRNVVAQTRVLDVSGSKVEWHRLISIRFLSSLSARSHLLSNIFILAK